MKGTKPILTYSLAPICPAQTTQYIPYFKINNYIDYTPQHFPLIITPTMYIVFCTRHIIFVVNSNYIKLNMHVHI